MEVVLDKLAVEAGEGGVGRLNDRLVEFVDHLGVGADGVEERGQVALLLEDRVLDRGKVAASQVLHVVALGDLAGLEGGVLAGLAGLEGGVLAGLAGLEGGVLAGLEGVWKDLPAAEDGGSDCAAAMESGEGDEDRVPGPEAGSPGGPKYVGGQSTGG